MNVMRTKPLPEAFQVGICHVQTYDMGAVGDVFNPKSVMIAKDLKQGLRFLPGGLVGIYKAIDEL